MEFAVLVFALTFITLIPLVSGQDNEDTLTFEVRILPNWEKLHFNIDDYKILTCEVSRPIDMEGQTPVLKWFFEDVEITETDKQSRKRLEVIGNKVKLRMDSIVDEDGGLYRCEGTLGGQTDTKSIQVEVYKKMEILSPKQQFGILGKDGTVNCTVTGKPAPSITWMFKDSTPISNNDKYTLKPGQLMIKELAVTDAQTYLCDIQIPSLGDAKLFSIDYTVTDPPKVDSLLHKPTNPKVGDKLELTCSASGSPQPTITFKKGENLVDDSMVSNGKLIIDILRQEDEAKYTCVATNKGGSDSMTTKLDVKIPPKVTISMEGSHDGGDPVEDQKVSIKCTAEGDPKPTIKWKKENMNSYYEEGLIENGPTFRKEDNNVADAEMKTVSNTMTFDSITFQDAGKYTCTARNVVGDASEETTISIRYGPKFQTDFTQRTFYGWRGHQANLTCQATANPTPTFRWYTTTGDGPMIVKDMEIQNASPYTVTTPKTWEEFKLSSSSLLIEISKLEGDDPYKVYICEASNSVLGGRSEVKLSLLEAVAPGKPDVEIDNILTTMVSLDIRAPSETGGQPVTGYEIEFFPNTDHAAAKTFSRDLQTNEKTRIEFMDLTMSTKYVVNVKSSNVVGSGQANVISFTTKKKSPPLRLVLDSNKEGTDATSYIVKWGTPEDGENPITQYIFNISMVDATVTEDGNFELLKLTGNEKHDIVKSSNQRQHKIVGLKKDTFYMIEVTAKNGEGMSDPAIMIFKTSKGEGSVRDESSSLSGHLAIMLLVLLPACLTTL